MRQSAQPLPPKRGRVIAGPRNPTLYASLLRNFGQVQISNEGDAPVFGSPIYSVARGRVESQLVDEGEYYRVNCFGCNDTRKRLYVNHLWCTLDPLNGHPMRHLAICYNESCLSRHYASFEEKIFGMTTAVARAAMEAMWAQVAPATHDADAVPLGPVAAPGVMIPVNQLPRRHRAAVYLRDERSFDLDELALRWGISFCDTAEPKYALVTSRIFVPIFHDGDMVGWQGRWPGDDWRSCGAQKYYNLPGFKKRLVLYNFDEARNAKRRYVVVCEGVTDVWAVGDGGVALLGKTISQAQRDLLAGFTKRGGLVVLMLDPDARDGADDKESRKFAAQVDLLRTACGGLMVDAPLPDGRDPGAFARRDLRAIIRDAVAGAGFSPKDYKLR